MTSPVDPSLSGEHIDLTEPVTGIADPGAAPAEAPIPSLPPKVLAPEALAPERPAPDPSDRIAGVAGAETELLIAPPAPREPTPLKPVWLIAAAMAGIMFDVGLRQVPWNNVGGALLLLTLAAGLLISGFVQSRSGRLLIAASAFFAIFLAIRTEPLLSTFNVLASCGLLVVGAIHGRSRPFWDFRPIRMVADAGIVMLEGFSGIVEVPAEIAARYRVAKEQADAQQSSTGYAVIRGLAIALPIVLLFGVLLASADVMFESFFSRLNILDPAVLAGHFFLLAFGAYTMMVLLRLGATQGATNPIAKGPGLGHIEAGVVLGAVNLLFSAFAVAQLMTVLGGAETALLRASLDSKHFARQGFFQLLWVAGLTLGLLMILHVATSENIKARGILRWLSLLTVALTVMIVAVALVRIGYYISDGGQTPLRLYAAVFSIWIAAAFLITAVRIRGVKPNTAWLMPVLIVSGLVTLGALNVLNPERVIALDNVNRDHDALLWHIRQGQFSGDGNAVLAANAGRMSPERTATIEAELCENFAWDADDYKSGLLDFNYGKWRANQELSKLCN